MSLSGRLRSSLIIGGPGIRARKLRTLLSMVSLFLGVLAVVAVQAGSVIAERALLSDIEMTTGRDGTLQVYLPSAPESGSVAMETHWSCEWSKTRSSTESLSKATRS